MKKGKIDFRKVSLSKYEKLLEKYQQNIIFYIFSGVFLAYASIILVALLISLTASVTSFVLRETIAHRFSKTDVKAQLNGYATDPFLRSRWDTIQKEFRCCGGYNVGTGYQDWEGVSIEPLPIGANPAALVTGKILFGEK